MADPRCISETETALHKFSLYNNRIELQDRDWEELLAHTKAYRQEMAQRR